MKSRVIFAISLALLLCCYLAIFVATWANWPINHLLSSLFPIGVCCYIALFISGILLPRPTYRTRAPFLLFCAAFATLVFCLLCPLVATHIMQAFDSFNPNSRHLYRSPANLEVTLLAVISPASHLAMLATGSVLAGRPSFFRSPLMLAGVMIAANPLWCIPILRAAHKMDGENAMLGIFYLFFYVPLGLYMLLFGAVQFTVRRRAGYP